MKLCENYGARYVYRNSNTHEYVSGTMDDYE